MLWSEFQFLNQGRELTMSARLNLASEPFSNRALPWTLTAVVALFSTASSHPVVIARSPGMSVDATAVVNELIARFGGRGGGKADLAQGGGFTGDLAAIMARTRELLQRSTSTH